MTACIPKNELEISLFLAPNMTRIVHFWKSRYFALVAVVFFLVSCEQEQVVSPTYYLQVGNDFTAADRNQEHNLIADRPTAGSWESFQLQKNKDQTWILLASDSSFVGKDPNSGQLKAGFPSEKEALKLLIDTLELNQVNIQDLAGNHLSVDSNRHVVLSSEKCSEPFRLHEFSGKYRHGFTFSDWLQLYSILALLFLSLYLFRHSRRKKVALVFLLAGAFLLRLWVALLNPHLEIWDEQFHALVAKNMMEQPFKPMLYVDPLFNYDPFSWVGGHVWLHKQPLFLWQMAASMKIFGVNTFGLRFPSVLMSALVVLFIYKIGKLLIHERAGFYGALFFALGNFILEITAGAIHTDHNDVAFLFYVSASIWAFIEYEHADRKTRKTVFLLLVGIFSGGAILTKWLTGILVFSGWGLYLLIQEERRTKWQNFLPPLLAFGIAVLVALPWQLYANAQFPDIYRHENLYNAAHFTEVIEGHGGGFFYHFNHFIKIYGLNFLFFIPAFAVLQAQIKTRAWKWVIGIYILVIYLFFSLAATKMIAFTLCVSFLVFLAFGSFFDFIVSKVSERIRNNVFAHIWSHLATILVFGFAFFLLRPSDIENLHTLKNQNPDSFLGKRLHSMNRIMNLKNDYRLDSDFVVFNTSNDDHIPLMFYNDLRASYAWYPSEEDLSALHQRGTKMAVFIDAHAPEYILRDSKIWKIPHYDVTQYYVTPHQ